MRGSKSIFQYQGRAGWARYYSEVYNKTGRETAAHLAVWYLLLQEAFGEN